MSDFSKGKWRYVETNNTVVINDDRYTPVAFLLGCSMFSKQEYQANGRLIAAAPEMYELLKEELIPTSDYGGILSFEREKKIRTLLTRIDGEEVKA